MNRKQRHNREGSTKGGNDKLNQEVFSKIQTWF